MQYTVHAGNWKREGSPIGDLVLLANTNSYLWLLAVGLIGTQKPILLTFHHFAHLVSRLPGSSSPNGSSRHSFPAASFLVLLHPRQTCQTFPNRQGCNRELPSLSHHVFLASRLIPIFHQLAPPATTADHDCPCIVSTQSFITSPKIKHTATPLP